MLSPAAPLKTCVKYGRDTSSVDGTYVQENGLHVVDTWVKVCMFEDDGERGGRGCAGDSMQLHRKAAATHARHTSRARAWP
jgi:hypothetical protein